jgi:glycosyltransferase involved in cell wall biosynthesis
MSGTGWDIAHIDLSDCQSQVTANARPLFAVFWWGALPLGTRTYLPEQLPLDHAALASVAADLAAAQLAARCPAFGGPARATFDGRPALNVTPAAVERCRDLLEELDRLAAPSMMPALDLSIIICTRDRPHALARCLTCLAAQQSPPGQIIVVDNSSDGTAEAVAACFPGTVYVHEPRPGLSIARNAGIQASRGALIAFTDDDVEPRPSWTAEVVRAFELNVDAVTGLVLPAQLETAAQCFFQFDLGGFGLSCVPTVFDQRFFEETCARGAQVWRIGAGANMAFRRSVFDRIGLFDERLGAGASGCSEDSELWYRLLASGGACLFEPRACVRHHHRGEWSALQRQVRAYMKGHVSALFVQAARYRHSGNVGRIFRQLPLYFARTAFAAVRDGRGERLRVLLQEIAGWFCGLQYALRPRWRARSLPERSVNAVKAAAGESQP